MRGDCMSMISVGQVQISKLDDYLCEWRSFRREMSWAWALVYFMALTNEMSRYLFLLGMLIPQLWWRSRNLHERWPSI